MDVTPEHKLKRFLHYGSEESTYIPGCRHESKSYTPEKLTCVNDLLVELKGNFILGTVKKVYDDKSSPYPEAGLFILAQCCLNEHATTGFKQEVYSLANKIIVKAEHLFVFIKFLKYGKTPVKARSGRGIRKLIYKWYVDKSALDLAEVVTLTPRYRGWSHKDLIKLSHLSIKDPAKNAVIVYAMKGYPEAKKQYENTPEAEEVLKYLATVDEFKKSKDTFKVARLIESYSLTVKHVNSHILKRKEVWVSLIRQISLTDLMDYFQLLSRNQLFRTGRLWDTDFVRCVCDAMGNPSSVTESGLLPNRVFIENCKYQELGKMKVNWASASTAATPAKPARVPPQVNLDLLSGFTKLFNSSFKNVKPTMKRYLIAVEGSETMKPSNCGYSRYVSCLNGAALIAGSIIRIEKKVDLVAFSQNDTQQPTIETLSTTSSDLESLSTTFMKIEKGKVDIKKLFNWAKKKQKEIDVFIVIGTYIRLPAYNVICEEFKKYEASSKVTNPKLIACSLKGLSKKAVSVEHPRALLLTGFDSKICALIEAFVRDYF